ncbi:hypothetical protein [Actinomyces sp. zg328]|uniref:hypothetical protein n=1 Tax=Actinomyces sp. zg328 TaxID=2609287 RepID=UPI00135A6BAB|nr:hypothetical protein [Actinomyces sp. zg328]
MMRRLNTLLTSTVPRAAAAALLAVVGLAGCAESTPAAAPSTAATAAPAGAEQPGAGLPTELRTATTTPAPLAAVTASAQCAAMDGVVGRALAETPEGQRYTALADSKDPVAKQKAWESFAGVLASSHRGQLADAAGSDPTATAALTSLDAYVSVAGRLSGGEISEYADAAQAEDDIKSGRTPTPNPEYQAAAESRAQAQIALTGCLSTWPVVF